jgi:hypothetical protein
MYPSWVAKSTCVPPLTHHSRTNRSPTATVPPFGGAVPWGSSCIYASVAGGRAYAKLGAGACLCIALGALVLLPVLAISTATIRSTNSGNTTSKDLVGRSGECGCLYILEIS